LERKRKKDVLIMEKRLTVALVAHDAMKHDLAEWVAWNWEKLLSHRLICTGTTGRIVAETLMQRRGGNAANQRFDITMLKSGPLGGDQQLGAMIANDEIDVLIFFWDPMSAQPHDVDVKALLRLATLYNVPTAINRSSADFIISSTLMAHADYKPVIKDYTSYIERTVK
jgi:methylglyoxal synthase